MLDICCPAAAGRAYLPSCTAFFATRMPEGVESYLLYIALPAVSLTWIAGEPLHIWGSLQIFVAHALCEREGCCPACPAAGGGFRLAPACIPGSVQIGGPLQAASVWHLQPCPAAIGISG